MTAIRPATPADAEAIAKINTLAFGTPAEAELVRALEDEGAVVASLVATRGGTVVGHILFSQLDVKGTEGAIPAASLAPMAVHPEHQHQGIGSALVESGLEACRQAGIALVVVLGHEAFYPRFGFSAALAAETLDGPFSGPAFMALELRPGTLGRGRARIAYARAFGIAEPAS